MAKVEITPAAEAQIGELPSVIFVRVHKIVKRLEAWPHVSGAKPLKGNRVGQFRIRTGSYRVIFQPIGDAVYVIEVGNPRDIYEE
jgi:mRNA-degrading endonuclease RelE of RelBE toxin-antitoxin system